jgi:threonine/homoserine/homoserine lactone efflux protein
VPTATTFALFCAAALALIVVPGPAVTYVVTQSLDKGRSAGLISTLGVASGGLVHVAAATAGLSALIASSASAFTVVKLAGAAYLIAIGLLRLAGRGESDREEGENAPTPARRLFWQGALVNVLNPKTALFILAFLPQFVDPGRGAIALQAAVLGAAFVVLAALSDSTYAVVAAALAGRVRGSRRAQQMRRYVSGTIFVALGVTAAAARQT